MKPEEEQPKESASNARGGFLGKVAFDLAILSEGILTGRQAKSRSPAGKGICAQENQYRGAFPSLSLPHHLSPSSSQKIGNREPGVGVPLSPA